MEKRNWSGEDVQVLVMAEMLSYECYRLFCVEEKENEYVDTILSSLYCYYEYSNLELPTLKKAQEILKADYDVDITKLPFQDEEWKEKLLHD